MPPKASKQSTRRDAKKSNREDDEPPTSDAPVSTGKIMEQAKLMALDSVLVEFGPMVPELAKGVVPQKTNGKNGHDEPSLKAPTKDDADENKEEHQPQTLSSIFDVLTSRLGPASCLGLGFPKTADEAKAAWKDVIGLELDWGPRKKRKGNPSFDRIMANLTDNMALYVYVLLALMLLRCILFRSFFCFLPWLLVLQIASVLVPLDKVPQVELKFRVVGTLGLHGLMWLFFLMEAVWKTYFFEKFFIIGLIAFHAHSVRPQGS